jgi:hypothetical protein
LIKTDLDLNPLVTAELPSPSDVNYTTLTILSNGKLLIYSTVLEFAHYGDFRCNGRVDQSP